MQADAQLKAAAERFKMERQVAAAKHKLEQAQLLQGRKLQLQAIEENLRSHSGSDRPQ